MTERTRTDGPSSSTPEAGGVDGAAGHDRAPDAGPDGWDSHADFYRNSPYGEFAQEHRSAGSFGANQIRVEQPAIDLVDPALPEYVFTCSRTAALDVSIDLGDGMRRHRRSASDSFNVVPPRTEGRFRVTATHELSIVSVPAGAVDQLLEQSGVRTDHPFARFHAAMTPVPEAARLMDAMWRASESGGPASNLWLDGLTLQLLAVLSDERGLSPGAEAAADEVRIRRAIDYLETYLDSPLTLGELARAVSMEEARFAQAFLATTGRTVWDHVEWRRQHRRRCPSGAGDAGFVPGPAPWARPRDRRLARAVDHVEAHLGEPLSVAELASVATMSASHFARSFKAGTGESVWGYVHRRRVERAHELVVHTDLSLSRVAERCGFSDAGHLRRAFRARHGRAPSEARG